LSLPLVNVWLDSSKFHSLPGVFTDYESVGVLPAEHFLTRGLHNFATLMVYDSRAYDLAGKAFCSTLGEAGFSCLLARVSLYPWNSIALWRRNKKAISDAMDSWQLPIGVYVCEENIGRILVQMCFERGWRVPEDVLIIAGENEHGVCEYPRPSLTSVDFGHERVGYEAARLLDRLMDGKAPPPEHLLLPR
jgi:LacI family transcriptional regulator